MYKTRQVRVAAGHPNPAGMFEPWYLASLFLAFILPRCRLSSTSVSVMNLQKPQNSSQCHTHTSLYAVRHHVGPYLHFIRQMA